MKNHFKALAVAGATTLVMLTGGAAHAAPANETITNASQVGHRELNFYDNETGTEPASNGVNKWSKFGVDSPNDRGERALHVRVPEGTADGNYYGLFYSDRSTGQNKLVGNTHNLSYDIRSNSDDGGGAPRISVEFLNGDVAYLTSSTCKRALTVDTRWSRADFTGAKNNCSFEVNGIGDTGGTYAADGTRSAWQVYADAHPEQRVSQAYMVFDWQGNYWVDHISLGTAWSYTDGDNAGVRCYGDETRC